MQNLKIGLLLHFYQPWWQAPEILKDIVNQCYRPILKIIEELPGFCFSANINYSLLELLDRDWGHDFYESFGLSIPGYDFRDVINGFKKVAKSGKIELLGSTAYHPIMPLIPKDLQILQMLTDSELKKALWGIERNCNGVFLPEMAFSQNILPNIRSCGYQWTVLDDEPFRVQYNYALFNRVVSLQSFKIFLRSNYWSNQIAGGGLNFKDFRDKLNFEFPQWTKNQPAYLIIAMDAETFGHHHHGLTENFLEPMLKEWGSKGENILAPIEEIGRIFPAESLIKIQDCSWATTEDDYWKDDPYPLWNSKFNPHHRNLWQLVNMALRHFGKPEANLDCLKITSSCHWWWISGRPRWEPEFMKFDARKAMEIIERHGSVEEIAEAKEVFEKLNALK